MSHSNEIEILKGDCVGNTIRDQLEEVLSPFYYDPTALLDREIRHCNMVLCCRDSEARIKAFAMFGYEVIDLGGQEVQVGYIGLSAVRQDVQNRGIALRLWAMAHADALRRESELQHRLVVWGTCITPEAYFGISTFIARR